MDNLDFAILRQVSHPQTFQWNVRVSYAEIARAVEADGETVRLRVLRLQEAGIIAAWEVAVHPAAFGRALVRFDTVAVPEEMREKVAAALVATDGARLLFEYYGGRFALVAYVEPGAATQRQAALLSAVTGGPTRASAFTVPPLGVELTPLDWRAIEALRKDPRAPYGAIAAAMGVSERTLRRRVERMTAGHALYLSPDVDLARIPGALPCMVRVRHGPDSPRAEIDAALRALPRIVFAWAEGDEARVSFNAPTIVAVEETRRRLVDIAGSRATIDVDLALRRVALPQWLGEQVARRANGAR